MYLKFLLIYSYLIVNHAECAVLSATRARSNFNSGIGARYRAPAFKSTGNIRPAQNNFDIRNSGVNKPINSLTGNIAVNAPLNPVNAWPNANTYPKAPPRPLVWNPAAAPKPVVQNDWPYARQPAYNPHFNFVNPGSPPKPEVQKDRPYIKQQPYNPNFNVPQQAKPAIQYPGPAPRPVGSVVQSKWPPYNPHINATSKPVIQNDLPYARQPACNPHFNFVSPGSPPRPEVQKDRPYIKQQPYNPNFNVHQQAKPVIQYPGPAPRPVQSKWPPYNPQINATPKPVVQNDWLYAKQPAYNPHFKMPPTPTPASRSLGSNQQQPPYNPHFKELIDQAIKNNGPTKLPSSINPNHLFNIKPPVHQPVYNSHFLPPSPENRNLISNQRQPSYSPLFQEATGPTILNQGSMQRQPRQNPLMPETSTINNHVLNSITTLYPLMITGNQSNNNHGKNVASKFAGVLGAVNAFVKKFTKNYDSTNVEQIFENPVLLSTQDSGDKFAVMDLINSYSPKDSNPFGSKESMQKSLISNKLPAVHRYNLKTKQIRKGKPFILVAIVISSVAAMAALIGGIIFCSKKKK